MYTCVYVCIVYAGMYTVVFMSMQSPDVNPKYLPSSEAHLVLDTKSLTGLDLAKETRMAGQ